MSKILYQIVVQSYTCKQSFTHFDNTNLLVSSCKKKWKHLIVETYTLIIEIYNSVTKHNYFALACKKNQIKDFKNIEVYFLLLVLALSFWFVKILAGYPFGLWAALLRILLAQPCLRLLATHRKLKT